MQIVRNTVVAVLLTVVTTVIFGVLYPLAVTGLAQLLFPHQANGSLIEQGGAVVGSALIGQLFSSPGYFHGRPSAAGDGYDATSSGGTNLGPTSRKLADSVRAAVAAVRTENPTAPVPVDLVTSSASGLDPDLSPAAAAFQIPRVARERGTSEAEIQAVVNRFTQGRTLGLLGEPRVNVLLVNLALDQSFPRK